MVQIQSWLYSAVWTPVSASTRRKERETDLGPDENLLIVQSGCDWICNIWKLTTNVYKKWYEDILRYCPQVKHGNS